MTGASGMIGSAAIREISKRYTAIGFDRDGNPHPPPMAECVCVDFTSSESLRAGFERVRYAYGDRLASVIHLAAYYDFSGEPSPKYEEITVRGTERLLKELRTFQVEQFLFSSTMLVHAPGEPGLAINEDSPMDPKWDYPKSKVETEKLIMAQRGDMPVVLFRIAGVYDDECHSIPLAHQIQRIYERKLISRVFPGNSSHGQAFVHLDDVVSAIAAAIDRRTELSGVTVALIGEPETLSYDEIQHTLGRLIHDEEWETQEIPKSVAKAGAWIQDQVPGEEPFIKPWMIDVADNHYQLDISRASQVLGWGPRRSLRKTLPMIVELLKADPAKWYRTNKLEAPAQMPVPTR
ncbi:MAG: NAD(P)-dependent oxidoreductase [Bryobacteraceae bacterium]|nr:NAD(P)-dependent oxidoreductase [Bryobacteraceae bacterium]